MYSCHDLRKKFLWNNIIAQIVNYTAHIHVEELVHKHDNHQYDNSTCEWIVAEKRDILCCNEFTNFVRKRK